MNIPQISAFRVVYPNGEEVVTRHVSYPKQCICEQCGEDFMAEPHESPFFCSHECDMEFQGIQLADYEWESPFPDFLD